MHARLFNHDSWNAQILVHFGVGGVQQVILPATIGLGRWPATP